MASAPQANIKTALHSAIGRFSAGRIVVVGDVAIDEMIYGHTDRISREAPVLILKHHQTHIILGAAGNAAHNTAALGAKKTTLIGVAGKDYYCGLLLDALQRDGVDASLLVQDENRPTTTKTRISGIANHSVTQQIIRVDQEARTPVSGKLENQLLDNLSKAAADADALVLSDYGLGVLTPTIIEHARKLSKQHGIILTVDSQQDLAVFKDATVITPNQPEAERNVGYAITNEETLLKAGKELLKRTGAASMLMTRGGEGMALFDQNGQVTQISAFNRSEVFDVTGAGDTVIGTLTLALATGADMLHAVLLGNLAASIVVKRFGAAVTNPAELGQALAELDETVLTNIMASTQTSTRP